MKEKAMELGAKVKERVQVAQKQLQGLEDEVQKFAAKVQDRFLASPIEGARKVDDLLRTLVVKDFVEKVRTIEMFKQSQIVKKDLLERFGLAAAEDHAELQETLAGLTKSVDQLKTKFAKFASGRQSTVTKKDLNEVKRRLATLEKAIEKAKSN